MCGFLSDVPADPCRPLSANLTDNRYKLTTLHQFLNITATKAIKSLHFDFVEIMQFEYS
jgi:hypothetical protein